MTYAEVSHDILAARRIQGGFYSTLLKPRRKCLLSHGEGVRIADTRIFAHLFELRFLTRRNVDFGAILHVCSSNHCANPRSTASDDSYLG
jgi:hypothetical protein